MQLGTLQVLLWEGKFCFGWTTCISDYNYWLYFYCPGFTFSRDFLIWFIIANTLASKGVRTLFDTFCQVWTKPFLRALLKWLSLNVCTYSIKLWGMTKGNKEFKMPSLMASSRGAAFLFLKEVYRMLVLHATYNPGKGFSEQQALQF